MRFIFAIITPLIFFAPVASAVEAQAQACAGGQPCKVIFTLDKDNNIILQEVSADHHRNEGVLRLTTEQAQKAALGPVSKSNVLAPEGRQDEFSGTIRALASVPGLSFLRGESPKGAQDHGAAGNNLARLPQKCRQIKTVMEATLQEAASGTLYGDQFITRAEVDAVCPAAQAEVLNDWYTKEKRPFLTQ